MAALAAVLGGLFWFVGGREAAELPAGVAVSSESTVEASFAELDVPTWTALADAIVIGRVQGAQTASKGVKLSRERRAELRSEGYTDAEIDSWVGFEESLVYTTSVVRISETLKGDLTGETVEVRHRGGVYGGHKTSAEGFPQLLPGREYVLVLGWTFDGAYQVAYAYEISKDVATSTLGGKTESWPLDELVALIKQHADDPNPFTAAESTTTPEPAPAAEPAYEASQTTAP